MPAPFRSLVPLLSISLGVAAVGDESRFDPKHRGSHLGLTIESTENALRVDEVRSGGAADRAGVKPGDILLEVGQWKWSESAPDVAEFLATHPPEPTQLLLQRDGKELPLALNPDPKLATAAREIARRISGNRLFRRSEKSSVRSLHSDLLDALRSTSSREAGYAAMNEVIDRFDLSHTAVLTPWVVENLFGDGEHYHLGMFFQAVEVKGKTRHFVRSLMFGSPARAAGLRIGDEIVSINNIPFASSPRRTLAGFEAHRRMVAIQIDRDETVRLSYRRTAGGKVQRVKVTPICHSMPSRQPVTAFA